jgi:transketolase
MLETRNAWRRRVSESYTKWKTDVWDPADEEEQAVLHKSLEIRMDEKFARETSGQHVKSAGKQFSALVSNDLCIIVYMWATDLTRLATGSGLHIAMWKISRSSEQSYILALMMMAEKV